MYVDARLDEVVEEERQRAMQDRGETEVGHLRSLVGK